jgi:hypothetical protein
VCMAHGRRLPNLCYMERLYVESESSILEQSASKLQLGYGNRRFGIAFKTVQISNSLTPKFHVELKR